MKTALAIALCALLTACGGGEQSAADTMTDAEIRATCDARQSAAGFVDASVAEECKKLGYTVSEAKWAEWMPSGQPQWNNWMVGEPPKP